MEISLAYRGRVVVFHHNAATGVSRAGGEDRQKFPPIQHERGLSKEAVSARLVRILAVFAMDEEGKEDAQN